MKEKTPNFLTIATIDINDRPVKQKADTKLEANCKILLSQQHL